MKSCSLGGQGSTGAQCAPGRQHGAVMLGGAVGHHSTRFGYVSGSGGAGGRRSGAQIYASKAGNAGWESHPADGK